MAPDNGRQIRAYAMSTDSEYRASYSIVALLKRQSDGENQSNAAALMSY